MNAASEQGSALIRSVVPSDNEALAELLAQLGYPGSVRDICDRLVGYRSNGAVLVAELDAEVVGFLSFHAIPLFHATEHLGRITAMCVREDRRRHGIGRDLLGEIKRVTSQLGCRRIEVTSGNHRADEAHRFYGSCGFVYRDRRFHLTIEQGV